MKKITILSFGLFLTNLCFGQAKSDEQIQYLSTFAKSYGYVKYFHPSDESALIDWDRFAIYGAEKVSVCNDKQQLIFTLNELFKPIAPAVHFYLDKFNDKIESNYLKPPGVEDWRVTFWQHAGVSYGMKQEGRPFISRRYKRWSLEDSLFNYEPEKWVIQKNIGSGLSISVPVKLWCNDSTTFPYADKKLLHKLVQELSLIEINEFNESVQLAGIIISWNIFQHFYPYFNEVNVNWEAQLNTTLKKSTEINSRQEYVTLLQQFTAPLNDGHIRVFDNNVQLFRAPVGWEWIENKLIITEVLDVDVQLEVGDVVTYIEHISSEEYFRNIYTRISAASIGRKKYFAHELSLIGDKSSVLNITTDKDKHVQLERSLDIFNYYEEAAKKSKDYEFLDEGIIYLNLDKISMDTIYAIMPELQKAKAIICDLRGSPNYNHLLICHLIQQNDTADKWMKVPLFVYPDNEIFDYITFGGNFKPREPFLAAKVIFITDASAISYAETYLGIIEGYKLATIVGQPTAGTNGNINIFSLPGNFEVNFTGMKVVKLDGSQLHGIGILPDVYVEKTYQGVVEGKDEFLMKAIEIAKHNIKEE